MSTGKRRLIVGNSFWMVLDTVGGILSASVSSILVARAMGPEKLGYYNYILWIANMTGQLGAVGIPLATRKFAAELCGRKDLSGARQVVAATLRFQTLTGILLTLVGTVVIRTMTAPEHQLYAFLAVLSTLPYMIMSVYSAGLSAVEDFKSQVKGSVTAATINISGVILTLVLHWGLVGLAGSFLFSRVIDAILRRYFYLRAMHNAPGGSERVALPPDLQRRMIRFCGYSTLLMVLNIIVWDRSELIFLKWFCDIRQVAFYSLGFNLVQQLIIVPRIFVGPMSASMLVEFGRDRHSAAKMAGTASRYLALLTLPAMLGVAAVSGPVIHLLYGEAFAPAIPVLAISAVFAVARSLIAPAEQLLVANEQQGWLLKWGIVCAVLNLILDVLLIRSYGVIGAAVANGLAQFISSVGIWVLAVRRCGARFPAIAAAKLLACAAVMALGVAFSSSMLSPLAALVIGVPTGIAIFGLLIWMIQPFTGEDRDRLMVIAGLLPRPASRIYAEFLRVAIPTT